MYPLETKNLRKPTIYAGFGDLSIYRSSLATSIYSICHFYLSAYMVYIFHIFQLLYCVFGLFSDILATSPFRNLPVSTVSTSNIIDI